MCNVVGLSFPVDFRQGGRTLGREFGQSLTRFPSLSARLFFSIFLFLVSVRGLCAIVRAIFQQRQWLLEQKGGGGQRQSAGCDTLPTSPKRNQRRLGVSGSQRGTLSFIVAQRLFHLIIVEHLTLKRLYVTIMSYCICISPQSFVSSMYYYCIRNFFKSRRVIFLFT